MTQSELIDEYCEEILKKGMYSTKKNLLRLMEYVFRYTQLNGKSMLEIGGGSGFMSLYAAASGARHVLNIEPDKSMKDRFEELVQVLGYNNVIFETTKFQDFQPGEHMYDVILSHNSINHLDEEACIHVDHNPQAQNKYMELFNKLTKAARPDAHLIIADCMNQNLFYRLGLKNPLAPMIEWEKHQPPEIWIAMLRKLGWINPNVRWTSYNTLGLLGRIIMGNRLVSYLTISHFCLVMQKPA